MIPLRQVTTLFWALCTLLLMVTATPDSAGQPPLPGPGLSYGGIPYGSMSGNVADYYKHQAPSLGRSRIHGAAAYDVNYAPIEQWL